MADSWTINVNGQIYGPYSLAEMRSFVANGRLAPHSMVAKSGEAVYRAADRNEELAPLFGGGRSQTGVASGDHTEMAERTRFVIVADMKTRSIINIDKELKKLGSVCSLSPQSWLLTTDKQINVLRDALMQQLGNLDTLSIIDASHNKAVWCNYDPQNESRIRQVWLNQT